MISFYYRAGTLSIEWEDVYSTSFEHLELTTLLADVGQVVKALCE